MVIKNKDGSTYRLNGPNPLMTEQDLWAGFSIHNMDFKEDTITNNNKETPRNKNKINIGKTLVENHTEQKREVISIQTQPEVVESKDTEINHTTEPEPSAQESETIEKPKSVNQKLLEYKRTVMHCLQADAQEKFDDLYGERSIKVKYTNKFNFESIMILEDDMQLVFWTHLEKVTKHSIVYPMNREKRWWKVTSVKTAPEGYFINCMPSQYHPNFA